MEHIQVPFKLLQVVASFGILMVALCLPFLLLKHIVYICGGALGVVHMVDIIVWLGLTAIWFEINSILVV